MSVRADLDYVAAKLRQAIDEPDHREQLIDLAILDLQRLHRRSQSTPARPEPLEVESSAAVVSPPPVTTGRAAPGWV